MNDVISSAGAGKRTSEPTARAILSRARKRVQKRLDRAVEFPILVMHAPIGFGKTTVLREFFAARALPYELLHVAASHGDLLGFMRVFAHALGDLVPALVTSFMGVHDRMHRADEAPKAIATWAAGHLEPVECTLLIDGLENVTDERLFTLLCELIDQTSGSRIRWVLVAASAERFPIARWLANDRMDLPIDDVDLALTFEDLATAVDDLNASIARGTLRHVCRTAANWPAAIALALSDVNALTTVASEPTDVYPYIHFAKRAFRARTDAERRFLLETCLYNDFTTGLLTRAGWVDVEPMLTRLHDAGAILAIEDNGVYRYHDLFRVFLQERLRASAEEFYARVAAASAGVCLAAGRWLDALELYLDLQAAIPLAEILSDHGFELMDRGETDSVYRALDALGDTEFAIFPVVLAVKASLESLHGSFDVAEAWFRHAIANVADPAVRAAIVYRFATDLVRQDRRDAIDLLEPYVAEEGHELGLSVSLAGLLATAYATHQQRSKAAATIERALTQLESVNDLAVRAKVYYQAGYVTFFARDPHSAKRYAQQAVQTALTSYLYDIAARALSILYNVAVDYEDDVRSGLGYLNELASCSIKAGSRHLLMYARLGQFEIAVLGGHLRESARLDEELTSLEVDYSVFASETLLPAQALRATWSGDFHRAYRLIAPTAEKQITPLRQSQRYAEIALYAAAAGLRGEATAAARYALLLLTDGDATDKTVVFATGFTALALNLLGRHRRAARILTRLTQRTTLTPRLEEFVSAILSVNERCERGRYFGDLRDTLERLTALDFGGIGRLIEALPLPQTFRGQFAQLSTPEREILIHLAAGLDASEVAILSRQSMDTVEGMIVSLCRKLGCTNSRHAVALLKSADALHPAAKEPECA